VVLEDRMNFRQDFISLLLGLLLMGALVYAIVRNIP
jgi:hypothetical protein